MLLSKVKEKERLQGMLLAIEEIESNGVQAHRLKFWRSLLP
jgi:hypothetical protein